MKGQESPKTYLKEIKEMRIAAAFLSVLITTTIIMGLQNGGHSGCRLCNEEAMHEAAHEVFTVSDIQQVYFE